MEIIEIIILVEILICFILMILNKVLLKENQKYLDVLLTRQTNQNKKLENILKLMKKMKVK